MLIAETLVNLTEDEIWELPEGKHHVVFQDKTILMTNRQIILSHYYWELFRKYPGCVINSSHAIVGRYTSKVHVTLGAHIFWDVVDNATERHTNVELVWDASETFYMITNKIYNMTIIRLSSYLTTASMIDLVEILEDPEIMEAKSELHHAIDVHDRDRDSIEPFIAAVHARTSKLLYGTGGELEHNGIKKLCIADTLSKGQIVQMIGPRGYVNDIDGRVFPYPIVPGYAEGLRTLYDSATESRSAARALFMNQAPLQDSEYFNREMQLLCSVVRSCTPGSCTGWNTITWKVEPGQDTLLCGKYHMVGDSPVLISGSTKHLVGQVIHIRSITGCGNHDVQTVCGVCLGMNYAVIPPGTNVGYYLATVLCAIISQLILSTKHYEGGAKSNALDLTVTAETWLRHSVKQKGRLLLTKRAVKLNPTIVIPKSMVSQLNDIMSIDINELPTTRLTKCTEIRIFGNNSDGNPSTAADSISLEVSGVGSSLSVEVLHYIKKNGWESTDKTIEITLKDWPINAPVFVTPNIADNVYLFLLEVKSFIIPTKTADSSILDYCTPSAAIAELIALVSARLPLNFTQAEIFIRACMCRNPKGKDYQLPRANESFEFASAGNIIISRSVVSLLSYQNISAYIHDSANYVLKERPKHLLDHIVT